MSRKKASGALFFGVSLACLAAGAYMILAKPKLLTSYLTRTPRAAKPWVMPEDFQGWPAKPHVHMDFCVSDYIPESLSSILYPSDAEENFVAISSMAFSIENNWLAFLSVILYVIFVHGGQHYLADKKGYEMKFTMKYWNLFLAVFSFVGMIRTVPHLFLSVTHYGVEYSFCRAAQISYGNGACGLWVLLFIYSKYFELFDTVILVLRKRQVSFLHWYHHASVLLYCWDAYAERQPTGLYFAAMNYTVHALMYYYYYLTACGYRPKWAKLVTVLQITQMVIGIGVNGYHLYKLNSDPVCDGSIKNLKRAAAMYLSYFILFMNFAIRRYVLPKPKPKAFDTKKSQ